MPQAIPAVGAAFASFASFAATPLVVVGGTTVFTVGNVALLGGSIALSAVSGAIQKSKLKKSLSAINNAAELATPQRDSNPAQRVAFGRVTTSGAFFFSEADRPHLWIGLLLAGHEIDAIEKVFINDSEVDLDNSGQAYQSPWYSGGNAFVEASFRLGTADQAIDSLISSDFASMPSTFRQRGHATAVFKLREGADAEAHKDLYGDKLWPRVQFRGIKAFDPRNAAHDVDDESTYEWTENAALLAMRYVTLDQRLGAGLPTSQVNWDKVAAAAELCDRYFRTTTGTEKSYTANGVVTADSDRFEVMEAFSAAMGGTLILSGRKVYPLPAGRREPVATIHSGLLSGAVAYQRYQPKKDRPNMARIEVVRPDSDYQVVAGPVYKDTAAIAADGQQNAITQSFAFVIGEGNAARAQRLAKFAVKRARLGRSLQLPVFLSPETVGLEAGDIVRVSFDVMPWVDGLYEVKAITESDDLTQRQMILSEWSNDALLWNPDDDEQEWSFDEDTLAA